MVACQCRPGCRSLGRRGGPAPRVFAPAAPARPIPEGSAPRPPGFTCPLRVRCGWSRGSPRP
ncbi:hypothetical protein FE633_08385 [Streptomyces montanus]|uniref:Uncharacterized protein n=1 Tax=Streptomyces montanus TaxID=2580423 RepID=A0A5R9FRT2_9ACTN|nr:hypothetical protein FE633_08385 [Streptomyces montanus]